MTSEILNSASPLIALIIDYALDMVGAVLLLIAGWIVAGWVQKHTARKLGAVERVDATLLSFVTQSVRYTILILVMVAVLAQFGVQTTSIIAVLGAGRLSRRLGAARHAGQYCRWCTVIVSTSVQDRRVY